ncbi:hypothetical protein AB0J82_11820 [Asanoa sp. NPDC049518]|uniref:hypothetical protein n=1 Tax=unclassified Asanoa TaxID=2685164 RepID=UPI00342C0A8D
METGVLKAAAFTVVTLVVGVIFTVWGLEGYLAHHGGVDGQVRVSTCDEVDPDEWSCAGTFVSDDGTVRITGIDIMPIFLGSHPGDVTERASVTGPSGSTAWLESERFPTPLIIGLVMLAGFAVSGVVLARLVRATAPATAPAPVAVPVVLHTESRRPHRVIWKVVVVGWLLPLAALTIAIAEYNRFNAAQESRLSQTGDAVVTAAGDRGVDVTVTAPDGHTATVRLTPNDPAAYPEGTRVPFRYDPRDPGFALPLDESPFEVLWVIERDSWSQFVFLLAVVLGVVWTWRLGRFATGASRRRPEAGAARALIATPFVGRAALWLEIVDSRGDRRHQRILWDRRLVEALTGAPGGPEFAVELRRCLGFRRMYVVDAPGVGRLWPGSTARRTPPFTSRFAPTIDRPRRRIVGLVLTVVLVAAVAWYFADPTMALLAATLLAAHEVIRSG